MSRTSLTDRLGLLAGAVGAVVLVIAALVWAGNAFASTDPGFIGLVRNGGPFDNTQLQRDGTGAPTVVPPGSALTAIGFASPMRAGCRREQLEHVRYRRTKLHGLRGQRPRLSCLTIRLFVLLEILKAQLFARAGRLCT